MRRLLLLLIFLVAFLLRFWQLGNNPPSLDWDEASLGYNAYSILKTGKDEYGNFLPLSIRSFGDYKPPLYTYLTTIPEAIFGLNEFSTRFISALFGTLTVLIVYLLVKKLFPQRSSLFYVLCSMFFAVSPWHLQFSRVAFEANLGLFFFILGIYLFLKGLEKGKFFLFSFTSFALSMYAYHSPRLVVPALLLGFVIIYRKEIKDKSRFFLAGLILMLVLIAPIINQLTSETAARFGSVTVLNPQEKLGSSIKAIEFDQEKGDFLGKLTHNRRIIFGREILSGYLDHFNFDFLFLSGDAPGRHHAAGMGMLYFWDLFFVVFGILYLLLNRNKSVYAIFWWFLVAPIASSLTSGTPHAVRALLYLPTYQIFAAFGVTRFVIFIKEWIPKQVRDDKRIVYSNLIVLVTFLFIILNFYYYSNMYYLHTPREYSQWWQYGYKQVVEQVSRLENNYDKIVVTYAYDQPYIFFLFYQKIDPSWYQRNWGGGEIKRSERSFGKYEFRGIDWQRDSQLRNTLLVGTVGEIPVNADRMLSEIKFLDGSVAFILVAR